MRHFLKKPCVRLNTAGQNDEPDKESRLNRDEESALIEPCFACLLLKSSDRYIVDAVNLSWALRTP